MALVAAEDRADDAEAGGGGGQQDTLVALANLMIRCWSTYQGSNENQGCYEMALPAQIRVEGMFQNQLGDADDLHDAMCDNDWREPIARTASGTHAPRRGRRARRLHLDPVRDVDAPGLRGHRGVEDLHLVPGQPEP